MSILPEDNKQTLLAAIIAFILTPAGFTFLSACLIVGGGATAWTYNVGKDVGVSAAANYSTADRLKLDKLAEEARSAAAELREATSRFVTLVNADESYKALKRDYDERVRELKIAESAKVITEKKLQVTTAELSRVQAELSKIVIGPNTYAISSEKAVMIADDNLFVVIAQNSYGSGGKHLVSINGIQKAISIGDTFEIAGLKSSKCTLFIKEYDRRASVLQVSATCS